MSSQGIASAIKRRTRPPEDPRKTSSLSSQQQSSSPGNSKLSVNPMQILYSHEMKIKKMEEQLTNNATSNNTNTNTNNTISRDEISGLVTSVLDTKLKDIDFQYSEKINKINHNMGVLVKNIETISKNFGTLNNGLGQYKKENEERIGNLFNSFKDLNGVLSQNLEYTKELASMRETIKADILNEVAATSTKTEVEEATTVEATEEDKTTVEATTVEATTVEATTEEATTVEATTEEATTEEATEEETEEVKIEATTVEATEEVKIEATTVEATEEVKIEATTVEATNAETREKVDSDLNVEDKSMALDIDIPTPKTQRKGKR